MKMLVSLEELGNLKSRDEVPLECEWCKQTFYATKNFVLAALQPARKNKLRFCSIECGRYKKRQPKKCLQCGIEKQILPCQRRGKNFFCSHSCRATWNNEHKTWGSCRSKLEVWIEKQLGEKYPTLNIEYNKRDAINAELDIYIPSLKLAFELNGIFHYEKIFGEEKLKANQTNDERKYQACLERGIELCVLDTSSQKYFKEETSKKFLKVIDDLICSNLLLA